MSAILYYLLLKPLSLLPLRVLYAVSDMGFLALYHLVGYRKKVVLQNLRRSFPNKGEKEVQALARAFYRHLCDLVVESLRLFSMEEAEAVRRCKCRNPELLDAYFAQGKSVVLGCGHYHNWELTGVSFAAQVKHQILCIYAPLSNAFFNEKMQNSRSRYGARLIPKKDIKQVLEDERDSPSVIVFGTDQNPSPKSQKFFWTTFLGQETAINFGMEKYARDYDYPAVFMKIHKMRRGYYEFEFLTLEDQPKESPYGQITLQHTRELERQIEGAPQYWLWSHKRWKRNRKPEEKLW